MEIVPVRVNGFDFVPVVQNIISDGIWPPSQEEMEGFAKFADTIREIEKSYGVNFSHKITLIGLLGGEEGRIYVTRDGGICADRAVAAGKSEMTIDEVNKKLVGWAIDKKRDKRYDPFWPLELLGLFWLWR